MTDILKTLINPDPLLSTDEAGAYLNENPRTLANQRSRGEGPDYVKLGHLVRYRRSALDRHIDGSEVTLGSAA